jgi:hypothetical protein
MAKVMIVQPPRQAQNYGPGQEPRSVRAAWDAYLQRETRPETEPELEPGA